jgi:hypothetical protein
VNRIFIGVDQRQPVAWVVLANSIIRHASVPVAITPLMLETLPIKRRGLTTFTYSRFLVPYLCGFRGRALFLDADMLVRGDIQEVWDACDYSKSVYVMQEQERFEWPSMMFFNCESCQQLTPEYVENTANSLFDLAWAEHGIGTIPADWNHAVGYRTPRKDAKLYHFTKGLPIWPETKGNPEDDIWMKEAKIAISSCSYGDLMGNSIHAKAS